MPNFDPYNINFFGHKLDPYRVVDIFRISHPAMQQIAKKVLRGGSKHKDLEADARDIITSAQRFLDMRAEERAWATQPEFNFGVNVAAGLPPYIEDTCPFCDGGPWNNGVCVCPK